MNRFSIMHSEKYLLLENMDKEKIFVNQQEVTINYENQSKITFYLKSNSIQSKSKIARI